MWHIREVERHLSIIDTLTAGFNRVTKRVWLATVPVLLDLFLWLGPKLSVAPVIDKTAALFRRTMDVVTPPGSPDVDFTEMLEMMIDTLRESVGRTNLLALLAWGRLGVPSATSMRPIEAGARWVIEIHEYWQMFLLQLLLLGVGLVIACVFLGILAQQVRGEDVDLVELLRRVPIYWVYMALIFVPLSMLLIFALSIGLLLGPFAVFIGVVVLWLMIYTSFVPHAVTLGGEKPIRALWSSFAVVRYNFWSTLGLILLTNMIGTGLGLVWHRLLMKSAIGTLVAILANAYVGTALTLALFVFYRERSARWHEALQQQRNT